MAHYDMSHRFIDPLLRITTFVGTPAAPRPRARISACGPRSATSSCISTPIGNSQLWRHATRAGDARSLAVGGPRFVCTDCAPGSASRASTTTSTAIARRSTRELRVRSRLGARPGGLPQPPVRARRTRSRTTSRRARRRGPVRTALQREAAVRDDHPRDQRPAALAQPRRRRREAQRLARRARSVGVRVRRRPAVQPVGAATPRTRSRGALAALATAGRVPTVHRRDRRRRSLRDVLRRRQSPRRSPRRQRAGFGAGIALRHEITFDDDPDLEWKMEHGILDSTYTLRSAPPIVHRHVLRRPLSPPRARRPHRAAARQRAEEDLPAVRHRRDARGRPARLAATSIRRRRSASCASRRCSTSRARTTSAASSRSARRCAGTWRSTHVDGIAVTGQWSRRSRRGAAVAPRIRRRPHVADLRVEAGTAWRQRSRLASRGARVGGDRADRCSRSTIVRSRSCSERVTRAALTSYSARSGRASHCFNIETRE